ncbi:MAG: hypothetical protein ACRD8Z_12080, partial [Nitrososphaeraceae archaeon]
MTTKMTLVMTLTTKTDALTHSIKLSSDFIAKGQEYHEGFIPRSHIIWGGDYSACNSKTRRITKAAGDKA